MSDDTNTSEQLIAQLLKDRNESEHDQHAEAQKVITELLKETRKEIHSISEKASKIETKAEQTNDYMHRLHEDHARLEKRVVAVEHDLLMDIANLEKHTIEASGNMRSISASLARVHDEQKESNYVLKEHMKSDEQDRKEMIRSLRSNNSRIIWSGIAAVTPIVFGLFVLLWHTGVLTP